MNIYSVEILFDREQFMKNKLLEHTHSAHTIRCHECDSLVTINELEADQIALCPECEARLESGGGWSLRRCAFIAISMLILMPFAFKFPILSINLLGSSIDASVWNGIWTMATSGYEATAFIVLIFAIVMPLLFALFIIMLRISKLLNIRPRNVLLSLSYIKPWVMMDVYLVSLAVTAVKVTEYSPIVLHNDILALIIVALLTTLLFIKSNPKEVWNEFYPEYQSPKTGESNEPLLLCHHCELTFVNSMAITDSIDNQYCPRCESKVDIDDKIKLQRTWAALIAGFIFLIPANVLPISVIYLNGAITADNLFSGVLSFINSGSYFVAFIVFAASIFIPFVKIILMGYLLISIHFKKIGDIHKKMKIMHFIHFVGRWSMLDLFVLALMMSLVTRGQLLTFSVGPAGFFFGAAVFLTMIAAEQFDSRILWKIYKQEQADERKNR